MNENALFNPGIAHQAVPASDPASQAVDSLRGYAYQAIAATLAWLHLDDSDLLFLEVAEDYAIVADRAIRATQVKDTERSGSVTLNDKNVKGAITSFVDLVARNPDAQVHLRFFTTSHTGTERAVHDRPSGIAGLEYWRNASSPSAGVDIAPLRETLQSHRFPKAVRSFCSERDDARLRQDLIQRIQWDCGRPDFSTIRRELDARMVVLGRDRFLIPADEAPRIGDQLIYQLLKTCILDAPHDRVLTRADLYRTIDAASRVSMPRKAADRLAQLLSLTASNTGRLDSDTLITDAADDWLIAGDTIPHVRGTIQRSAVESALSEALSAFGTAVLVGGSGLGKSTVSRSVADALPGDFALVQFGYADETATSHRLDILFGTIAGLHTSRLILDDLKYLEHQAVSLSLARVIESTRRHNFDLIITCPRTPSITELTQADLNHGCVIDCPYFTADETRDLITKNGGDPDIWAQLAYVAGAYGHPQLTHAFVIGAAARGWRADETQDILRYGLLSDDVNAARDAARRRLVYALPEPTRELLYRLSLTAARFTRSVAFAAASLSPPIPQTAECMDHLIGPWISAVGNDQFYVSPLASTFGHTTLSPDQQRRVHRAIAREVLKGQTIDASQADATMAHALLGECPRSLTMLARSVLSAEPSTLSKLAAQYSLFLVYQTVKPIYSDDLFVSALLRLAQFKLAVAGVRRDKIPAIAHALLRETSGVPDADARHHLETMAVISVLSTIGISNYLDDWVALLVRCRTIVETNEYLQECMTNIERHAKVSLCAGLFSIGIARLASVERLESIIDDLDELNPGDRALLLTPIRRDFSDYSDIISGPWVAEQKEGDLDAGEAAIRYERMAHKTRHWGLPALSGQCTVAQATMLDEYQNDRDGALAALKAAAADGDGHPIVSRAIGNIHMRHGQHDTALNIFRSIADIVGHDNPIERTFALRTAAMSAAECGQWSQAAKWFLDAHDAARLTKSPRMHAMAIGLRADSAVAALQAGDRPRALTGLAKAIEGLRSLDPDETLGAAYCHRVVRHTVLWVESNLAGSHVAIDGQPLAMAPGTCSNPEPMEAIRELPLGDVDVAWYMLAKAEVASGVDINIAATLGERLAGGPIPALELDLHTKMMQRTIDTLNVEAFARQFKSYIEFAAHVLREPTELMTFDPLAPKRGTVRSLNASEAADPAWEEAAKDPIISFMIRSAVANQPHLIRALKKALESCLSDRFPGGSILGAADSNRGPAMKLEIVALNSVMLVLRKDYVPPDEILAAGFGIFEWTGRSSFGRGLAEALSRWLRSEWQRISTSEAFRFVRPWQTVPVIRDALAIAANDRAFAANLLLAASDAVSISLSSEYRNSLESIARSSP